MWIVSNCRHLLNELVQHLTNLFIKQNICLLQPASELREASALLIQLSLKCVALGLKLGVLAAQLLGEAQELSLTLPAALYVALEVSHLVSQSFHFLLKGRDFLCITVRKEGVSILKKD